MSWSEYSPDCWSASSVDEDFFVRLGDGEDDEDESLWYLTDHEEPFADPEKAKRIAERLHIERIREWIVVKPA